jgi:thymidylate synthase
LLKDILENGTKKGDRTGTGTTSVFGRQIRFDLSQGFPICTTKKIHWKSVVHELLWLISGSTNIKYLKDNGVTIWNEWQGAHGDLGPVYGKEWREWEDIRFVEPKIYPKPAVMLDSSLVAGVGKNGDLRSISTLHQNLYNTWSEMLHRCYNESREHFQWYGAKGVHVDSRWFDFQNFVDDVQKLENWGLKKAYPEKYSLDKDCSGSNRYGPEDCIWASEKEQRLNTSRSSVVKVTTPEGNSFLTMNLGFVCQNYDLDRSSISKCLRGERSGHKGFTFEQIENPAGFIPRIRLIDQLAEVIERIKTKPDDRRLIVTAWNPADVPKQKLPPCHAFYQFWTRPLTLEQRRDILGKSRTNGGRSVNTLSASDLDESGIPSRALSCHMYQRSADAFLGVPFNIASYALLTHMVAQVVGMVPDEFVHSFGDLHIYSNHFEQVNLQLSREPMMLPTLKLNPAIKNIDDFTFSDIELVNYQSWPAIKAPVAI